MAPQLSEKEKKTFALIKSKLFQGQKVTLREINEVTGGLSPRSAVLIIERLVKYGLLEKDGAKIKIPEISLASSNAITTIDIPLLGSISCGTPIFAEQNIDAYIPVSTGLAKPGNQYFMLRASGNSMNLSGINNGDILLVRQQNTAENGARVVALIDDEATVKILERKSDVIVLRPNSTETKHKPIVVSENCMIQGEVVAVLPPDII